MTRLRIAVADDEPVMQEFFQEALARLGHEVVAVAANGGQLVQQCRETAPDLVITDIRMPDMDGLDAAQEIYRHRPIPIVVVSAHHDPQFIERAQRNHILAYLLKPIQDVDLLPAINIAMRRFEEFEALHQEADDLRQALEDRKIIERAKGVLMRQAHLDEEAAFSRLQDLARTHRKKLIEVAQMVVVTADALAPIE